MFCLSPDYLSCDNLHRIISISKEKGPQLIKYTYQTFLVIYNTGITSKTWIFLRNTLISRLCCTVKTTSISTQETFMFHVFACHQFVLQEFQNWSLINTAQPVLHQYLWYSSTWKILTCDQILSSKMSVLFKLATSVCCLSYKKKSWSKY